MGDSRSPPKDRDLRDIDRGSDLIDVQGYRDAKKSQAEVRDVADEIHSIEILIEEGFANDAKLRLRELKRSYPKNLRVKKLLDELYESEIQKLLKQRASPDKSPQTAIVPRQKIIDALERDLEIDLKFDPGVELDLATFSKLKTKSILAQFDLALSLAQMSLSKPALQIANYLVSRQDLLESENRDHYLSACALFLELKLECDEPLEAILKAKELLSLVDLTPDEKTHFAYWLARGYEMSQRDHLAISWYKSLLQVDENYRDSEDRLKRLEARIRSC